MTIVGFHEEGRARIEAHLRRGHVSDVRHVAPSWEDRLDKQTVRAKCNGADVVVEMADRMKHDAANILRGLQQGMGFERLRVSGGSSLAIYFLDGWAAKQART